MNIDANVLLKALQTKLKLEGKLQDRQTSDTNVTVIINQEAREKKLQKGLNRFGVVLADNNDNRDN